jgi:hypothetical protein
MIEIQYKTKDAYSFHAFSLKELRTEIRAAKSGEPLSSGAIIKEAEKHETQKEIAARLHVSSRYLRYIKTGERLRGSAKTKKDRTLRNAITKIGRVFGIHAIGGYSSGQLRAANYLDFICEKSGEIAKDIHEIFYEHGAMSISHVNDKGLYQYLQNNMHATIQSMCEEGSYCEEIILYRRGNKHPKKDSFCKECGEKLIAVDNKRLIYTVVMKK